MSQSVSKLHSLCGSGGSSNAPEATPREEVRMANVSLERVVGGAKKSAPTRLNTSQHVSTRQEGGWGATSGHRHGALSLAWVVALETRSVRLAQRPHVHAITAARYDQRKRITPHWARKPTYRSQLADLSAASFKFSSGHHAPIVEQCRRQQVADFKMATTRATWQHSAANSHKHLRGERAPNAKKRKRENTRISFVPTMTRLVHNCFQGY